MLNKLCGTPYQTGGKSTLQHVRARSETFMKTMQAVEISKQALAFLASRPEDLQRFLTASGLDAAELLEKSDDAAILAAVLGFVSGEETLAKDFSEAEGLKPGMLLNAYARLDPHGSSAW
jgi:hypothetical protein